MSGGVLDLFAGAGGWDLAARELGLNVLGIEWDDQACQTREAAGLATLQADVAELDPADFAPCWGLIGSPPCQAWSIAGKRAGALDQRHCVQAAQDLAEGRDMRQLHARACKDERSILVVEPLRWALALRPEWIALEQVPPVLSYWCLTASLLEGHGYRCWAGVLEAERYGVPQTRERAILMAERNAQPHPPLPTHQRFVSGEPARHEHTLEGDLLPWVSMAEALGWGMTERPCVTVAAGSGRQGGPDPLDGGAGSRSTLERERERGAWITHTHTHTHLDVRQTGAKPRPVDQPAPTMLGEGLAKGVPVWRNDNQRNACEREMTEPAPTVHFGHCLNRVEWVRDRPATTVNGDSRISRPGHHDENESGSQQRDAVRVTVQEAAILQSFPADYPWQGSRTAKFRQVGNAIPPLLAKAILSSLLASAPQGERSLTRSGAK